MLIFIVSFLLVSSSSLRNTESEAALIGKGRDAFRSRGQIDLTTKRTSTQFHGWCSTQTRKKCCPGYSHRNVNGTEFCEPHCNPQCTNGFCMTPNFCQCFPDHVRTLGGDCVPTCPISCLHGVCTFSGKCICHEGYHLHKSEKFCVPTCKKECDPTRNCTSPDRCSCFKGYWTNQQEECRPMCVKDCLHGICVAPDVCLCNDEYFLVDGICQAYCSQTCVNGKCLATDYCLCDFGYLDINGVCTPQCSNCNNGTCIGPENCLCYEGFYRVAEECVYFCSKGCHNGDCVGPETCICKTGYHMSKNHYGKCSHD